MVLDVSRSGFYAWQEGGPSARRVEDEKLTVQIAAIHEASGDTYGSPRVRAELEADGVDVGRKGAALRCVARASPAHTPTPTAAIRARHTTPSCSASTLTTAHREVSTRKTKSSGCAKVSVELAQTGLAKSNRYVAATPGSGSRARSQPNRNTLSPRSATIRKFAFAMPASPATCSASAAT